ncbi:hypothetical protein TNCV_1586141 [Trichonephila clavipes]|uniref:Uncharacterized protein n=1 Tax=Trichonephila clavipes TaxID=2585209 RepID=A0A8X6S5K4_TRICX|nr:hypothetical protein TNCV_1586141 [Trichonephila clavipes]
MMQKTSTSEKGLVEPLHSLMSQDSLIRRPFIWRGSGVSATYPPTSEKDTGMTAESHPGSDHNVARGVGTTAIGPTVSLSF